MPKAGRGLKVVARDHGADTRSLRRIGRKLEASIGAEFFQVMARHLASALEADCVLVGEFVGGREERCRTVAAWMHGAPADFDYALAGSATAAVVLGKPVH